MRTTKKAKLEAKGWRIGSADDFLGLSEEESQLIDLKLMLSDALVALRKQKKLTQERLANRLHTSQSRIAKLEAGDPSVSFDLLIKAYFNLGASTDDLVDAIGARKNVPETALRERRASYVTTRQSRAKPKK